MIDFRKNKFLKDLENVKTTKQFTLNLLKSV